MSLRSVEPGPTSLTICKQTRVVSAHTHRAFINVFTAVTRRVDVQATLVPSPLPRK